MDKLNTCAMVMRPADNQTINGIKGRDRKFDPCLMLQSKLAEKPRINAIRAVDRVRNLPPP